MEIIKKGKVVTFEEAADDMIKYYASLHWSKSVENAEALRKKIWIFKLGKYPTKIECVGRIRNLKDSEYA